MKTYKIPCTWVVSATIEIEADTIGEAILKAELAPLPTEPDYMEGSFVIDLELMHQWLEEEKE
tara:strand:+ start:948 stop:1136 length:189 start_codon:yes stop_codon:yes gene_type:complete